MEGVDKALGLTITGRPYTLVVHPERLQILVSSTEALLMKTHERPEVIASTLGSWPFCFIKSP